MDSVKIVRLWSLICAWSHIQNAANVFQIENLLCNHRRLNWSSPINNIHKWSSCSSLVNLWSLFPDCVVPSPKTNWPRASFLSTCRFQIHTVSRGKEVGTDIYDSKESKIFKNSKIFGKIMRDIQIGKIEDSRKFKWILERFRMF